MRKYLGVLQGLYLIVFETNAACYHQNCDRVRYLAGPGYQILEQNMGVLAHMLELYSSSKDIESLLTK